jgi:hypothetical protein
MITSDDILELLNSNYRKTINIEGVDNSHTVDIIKYAASLGILHQHQHNLSCYLWTNEASDFISNHNNGFIPVPITHNEWINAILEKLKNGKQRLNISGDVYRNAYDELINGGFIKVADPSYYTELDYRGIQLKNMGCSYSDYFKPKEETTIHNHGHNIGAVYDSVVNIDSNLKNAPTNIKSSINSDKSKTDNWTKWGVVITTIALLLAAYEFWLKYHI